MNTIQIPLPAAMPLAAMPLAALVHALHLQGATLYYRQMPLEKRRPVAPQSNFGRETMRPRSSQEEKSL